MDSSFLNYVQPSHVQRLGPASVHRNINSVNTSNGTLAGISWSRSNSFPIVAFVIDPATNRSVDVTVFCVIGALGDLIICSRDAADIIKPAYESGGGFVTMEVEPPVLRAAEIRRSVIATRSRSA